MIFSTRSTYGLRAMINLAKRQKRGSVSLHAIAQEEKISLKYLERLFANLKKAGLVKAEIGAGGGYRLAKSPRLINVYVIIKVLEGQEKPFHCLEKSRKVFCGPACRCGATLVMFKLQQAIAKTLTNIKLSQLL